MEADPRKISVCVTFFNRSDMIGKCIEAALKDDRVSEIIIIDDQSSQQHYNSLLEQFGNLEKVKLSQNNENIGCYRNKHDAISRASNENVCIWDSDNQFDKSYIDKLYEYGFWNPENIYAPSLAGPFDYRAFEGSLLNKQNIAKFVGQPRFDAMMNTMNYFVNRDEYLKVWDSNAKPYAIDSIYHNLQWIKSGRNFFVVPGLNYDHTVHKGSLYMKEGHLTQQMHKNIINEFKAMR
jgi:glycosyltransferase involved in cell wall biosynthesis